MIAFIRDYVSKFDNIEDAEIQTCIDSLASTLSSKLVNLEEETEELWEEIFSGEFDYARNLAYSQILRSGVITPSSMREFARKYFTPTDIRACSVLVHSCKSCQSLGDGSYANCSSEVTKNQLVETLPFFRPEK